MAFEGQNELSKPDEIIQDNKVNDVADKFRAYRLNAESTAAKLKEANNVIDQLKTEINICKNVEANLRNHITLAENRLIYFQKTKTKFLTVADGLRQSEKASLEIERKIGQLEEAIQKIKNESQNVFKITSNEMNLMKKCEELKFKLKNKDSEMNLLKIENETLSKQKLEIEAQAEHNYKILEKVIGNLRQAKSEMQAHYDQTLELYKKQIDEKDLTLKEYERERKSFLEDFAMPKTSESSSDVAWADSTVALIPDDRSPKNSKVAKRSIDSECEGQKESFSISASSQGNKPLNKRQKHVSFKPEKGSKQKPQLEFLLSNASRTTSPDAPPAKRRLFSMNCNHYVN